jgi:hypothetical protein
MQCSRVIATMDEEDRTLMGERQDDGSGGGMSDHTHGIQPWFPDWLAERERTRGEPTGGGSMWDELHDALGPQACGVYYVLLTIAHGQRTFSADPRDVLALLDLDVSQFDQLLALLVQRGVIAVANDGDATTWTILRKPVE